MIIRLKHRITTSIRKSLPRIVVLVAALVAKPIFAHENMVMTKAYDFRLNDNSTRHYYPTGISHKEFPIAIVSFERLYCGGQVFNHSSSVRMATEDMKDQWYILVHLAADGCEAATIQILLFKNKIVGNASWYVHTPNPEYTRMVPN